MANEKIVQIPLANVARVELVTEETTPKTYVVDTANEMKLEAFVSEGEEKELRKLNRLLAQLKTEDLTKGYDLTMKDMVMSPPVFALVDGGVSTTGAEGKFEGYTGPKMGEVVNRTPFTVNIYTEEKDGDGETTGYLKFTCKHCKGTPADIEIKENSAAAFFTRLFVSLHPVNFFNRIYYRKIPRDVRKRIVAFFDEQEKEKEE